MLQKQNDTAPLSCWKLFRLIFVIFSLYLLGDAFYRWDGFRYYAPFSEFIPSVALATVLWSMLAALTSITVWFLILVARWLLRITGFSISSEHLLFWLLSLIALSLMALLSKKLIVSIISVHQLFTHLGLIFLIILCLSIFLTWLLRNKLIKWMSSLQEFITPLVWIFGIVALLSVPVVTYFTWTRSGDHSAEIDRPGKQATSRDNSNLPNILLVTFDALTSRDMSLYGYHRETTPFIDKWSKTAVVFTRAYAASNMTASTTASLMTGKRDWTHQRSHLHGLKPFKVKTENLPLLLKEQGYYNIVLTSNPVASVKALGLSDFVDYAPIPSSFNTPSSLYGWADKLLYKFFGDKIQLHDWIIKGDFILYKIIGVISRAVNTTPTPPDILFDRFVGFLDKKNPSPYFAWLHLNPPHQPYLPPEPYMGMFEPSLKGRTYDEQKMFYDVFYTDDVQPEIDILRARYNEFIRYCDSEFENFIKKLEEKDMLNNTIIILSADHGESFEHNYFSHGSFHLYESVTHIPLVIKMPGRTEGRRIRDAVSQIDIPYTILELAGRPAPDWMEGRSLLPALNGEKLTERPIFSMNYESNPSLGYVITKGVIAVWEGDYKLIHYLGDNRSMLFNVTEDHREVRDLFNSKSEIGRHLLDVIQVHLAEANARRTKKAF